MAYIGKQPVVGNFQKCDAITVVNGQAAYTLNVGGSAVSPENANHMLVSLNGVLQAPGDSFTVSGSTLTFASNLATGDVIDFVIILGDVLDLGAPSDNTVTTAKLGANSVTSAKLNNDIISGTTALATAPDDTDEFLVSDAGTLKRIDYSLIKGGGAFEKLVTTTASDVASVEFNNTYFTTDYTDYQFRITDMRPATNGGNLRMFISSDNGSTYESTGSAGVAGHRLMHVGIKNEGTAANLSSGGNDDNDFNLTNNGISNTNTAASFIVDIFDPLNQLSDTKWFHFANHAIYYNGTYGFAQVGGGMYVASGSEDTVFNSIKFDTDNGNINRGTFTLYGRKT